MKDLGIKQKTLQEIIDLMDEREGSELKNHPKLIAAKIEVKPEGESEDPLQALKSASADEDESAEDLPKDGDEVSPEDLKKLLEHFQSI